jgi:two-component system, OmpR family, response regulator VicR
MHDRPPGVLGAMNDHILVIEDDPTLSLVLRDNLRSEGYQVDVVGDGISAIRTTQTSPPDLIVLDLTLPDCDGFDLLPVLRQSGQVPIIVLTVRARQPDKVRGLTLGADDYITKPFDPAELLARVRVVLRRARPSITRIRLGRVTVDFPRRQALAGQQAIFLTHREFELLSYLAEHRDRVVRRQELLHAVWGYLDADISTRTVDFTIARLRKKIEVDHHHPQFIRTAHGDGYRLTGVSGEFLDEQWPG